MAAIVLLCAACEQAVSFSCEDDDADQRRPSFWTRPSHCPGEPADYTRVFDDTTVRQVDITIATADYDAMIADLDELVFGDSRPADADALADPITVPVTVSSEGFTWTQVGMRWKGHSSLLGAWQIPIRKLSFRLTFDEYEDAVSETADQRFFGFRHLNFSNNYNDPSFIREAVAGEIFRAAGVPAARAAFAAVFIDTGDGPVYHGLYTMVEDPSDELIETQFVDMDTDGNLYKPWSDAARWQNPGEEESEDTDGWGADIEQYFEKKTNETIGDWDDVKEAVARLHEDTGDAAAWRARLEEVFDVQSFIDTLAVSRAIMNWDSYGCMHHNYYLYADPADGGRLVWFPWDLGETMLDRQDGTCVDLHDILFDGILMDQEDGIDTHWPLISKILGDDVYMADYRTALRRVLDGAFTTSAVHDRMERYHDLVAPWIVGPDAQETYPYTTCPSPYDCESFRTSLDTGENALKPHVTAQIAAVNEALEDDE